MHLNSPQKPQVLVQSQLTQNYRLASKLNNETELHTILDATGALHILFVGNDNHAYDAYMDDSSDTGWSVLDLGYPDNYPAKVVAGVLDESGHLLYFLVSTRGIAFSKQGSNPWSVFAQDYYYTGVRAESGYVVVGYVENGISGTETLYPDYPWQGNAVTPVLWDWRIGVTAGGMGLFTSQANVVSVGDSGVIVQLPGQDNYGTYSLDTNNINQYPSSFFSWVALAPDVFGNSKVFVLENASGQVARADFSSPEQRQDVGRRFLTGQDSLQFSVLVATGSQNDTNIEYRSSDLFMIGTDQCLYHCQEFDWQNSDIIKIHNLSCWKTLVATRDAQDKTTLIASTLSGQLFQIYRDPETTDWVFEEIEVGTSTSAEMVQSYTSQITITDSNGLPMSNTAVTLSSPDSGVLTINGTGCWLEAGQDVRVNTNPLGKLTVVMPINSLAAMTLNLQTPFMTETEAIVIEPNADLQNQMANLTPQALLKPINQSGDPISLLQGEFNTPAVAQAVADALAQSAQLMYQPTAQTQKYLETNTSQVGLRYVAQKTNEKRKISFGTVPDSHWGLSFDSNGLPSFSKYSRAEAVALIASRNATLPDAAQVFGASFEWGDLWNAVGDAVAEIGEILVSAVIDTVNNVVQAIEAQITLFVNNVQYVFNAAISLVEQAISMVQGIFQKVGVAFKDLFDWLGNIFAWDDIQRTAQVLEYSIGVIFDFSLQAIGQLETAVDQKLEGFFAGLAAEIDALMAKIPDGLTVQSSLDQYVNNNVEPVAALGSSRHNPLLEALTNHLGQTQITRAESVLAPNDLLSDLIKAFENLAASFNEGDGKKAFDAVLDYIRQIGDNPSQFWTLGLKAGLSLLKGLLLAVATGVRFVTQAFFLAFQALIQTIQNWLLEEWYVPVVSEIYQLVTGNPLSFRPIRIITLAISVGTTPLYKTLSPNNQAPFPNAAAVTAVTTAFTPSWLMNQLQPTAANPSGQDDNSAMLTLKTVFADAYAATMMTRILFDTLVHITPWGQATTAFPASCLSVLARLCNSVFSVPWVMAVTDPPSPNNSPSVLVATTWGLNVGFGPLTSALFLTPIISMQNKAETRDALLITWGAIHLVLIGINANQQKANGSPDTLATLEESLNTIVNQFLRFFRDDGLAESTGGISLGVYGASTSLTNSAIAVIHLKRFKQI